MRTGVIRGVDATLQHHRSIPVRESDDGTVEYFVGDTAHNRDGWAAMPLGLVAEVTWDGNMASVDSATTFTLEERTEMSKAFDRGNVASAYETNDIESCGVDEMPEHCRAAFVLGFFGSCSLDEIAGSDRELFDEAYSSPAGRYIVKVARYTDDRADEYAAENT